jgi:aminopeptidase N
MNIKPIVSKFSTFFTLLMFVVVPVLQARPMLEPQDDKPIKRLPPAHYVRSRNYDMQNIALDLKFDWEKEQAYGTATITLAPLVPDLKMVDLDAGLMTINSVKLAGGGDLVFQYEEEKTRLGVSLDRVYRIGEPVTFIVDYRTKGLNVPNTLSFGGGGGLKFIKPTGSNPNRRRQVWSQGESDYNRFWFPSYDSPNDFATTEITATVEKQMFVVSNGKMLKNKENKDGTRTFYWKMDIPHANYLTSIVVGEYAEVKGSYLGIPISSYVFPNELKEGQASTGKLPRMVQFFSEKTGVKYPYAKYAQTMAEGFGGGMENISATTMTPSMIHDERELLDGTSEGLQSHELAHQWFGDYVTCREWAHIWLNESFATYMQALWDEHEKGKDYFLYSDVRSNQQGYINTWRQGNRRPIVTRYYVNADDLFDTYAYPRGGAVLHMLRKHLGDELFFKSINRYLTTNANRPVQTEQLRIAIEETTGQSMDWFFDEWLYKMGHPIFEVTDKYENGKLTMTVKQTQQIDVANEYPQVAFFQTFVDIKIDDRTERVWIEPKAENVFTFNAAAQPKLVSFDTESTLIKELKFEKSTADLIYQLQNDSDVTGRAWALNQLKDRKTDEPAIRAAIVKAITDDTFWPLRRDAIDIVAAWTGDGAQIAAFEAAAKDNNSNVRAVAIRSLGALKNAKYTDIFLAALNDQSYAVVDSAATALARTADPRAFDSLAKLTATASWKDRVRIAGLNGLSTLADKRGLDIGLKYAADTSVSPTVRSTALNVVAATGKGDARAYPLIMENFKIALEDGDFQPIFNGFRSFTLLADPRGQEAFDMAKEKYKERQNLVNFIKQAEDQFKKALEPKQ